MDDSDWQDPFADDEAARERAARRAERAARRREREQEARESLSERVKELTGETEQIEGSAEPPPPTVPPAPEPPPPTPAVPAKPPPPPPGRERVHHRRRVALLVLGAAIVLGTGAGVLITRAGDDGAGDAPAAGRKTIEVTIPEGYDRSQIANVAREAGLKGNYEKETVSSKRISLKRYGAGDAKNLEGFLFPATYEVFRGSNAKALVNRQLEAFESSIEGVDMSEAKANGLSAYEVVNVASMIEREIQVPEERPLAASVIYNRLAAGNPLGIDATIRFEDQNYDEPLLESRLNKATPYNTRVNPGLPPGPIGNPGLASLEAAANPDDTDFFYYVIKPGTCNEHVFLETEAEFQEASAEYQAALQAEGGSPTDC